MGVKGRVGHLYAPLRDGSRAHQAFRRGVALQASGQADAAIMAYRTATALKPDHADAFYNLGIALGDLGRTSDAITAWERYQVLQPGGLQAYTNLGRALINVGRAADALQHLTKGCTRYPDNPELLALSGRALLRLQQPEAALGALILASDRHLDDPALHTDLSAAFAALGHAEQAATHALTAYRLSPTPCNATTASGAMIGVGDFMEALTLADQAVAVQPRAEAHINRAIALDGMGRFEESVAAGWDAVSVAPGNPTAWHQLATCRLSHGELTPEVWEQFEWRLHLHGRPPWTADKARWVGQDVRGKTVLLHAEQGLGDTLQFVRYAGMVAARGARVVLAVQPSLVRLLGCVPGVHEVAAIGSKLPRFDLFCPLMSLPGLFGTTLDTIPSGVPYIRSARVVTGEGFRVGLAWAGNKAFAEDRQRSLALRDLLPLRSLDGVQLFGLQPGSGDVPELGITDLMAGVTDFADTAAIVAGLDLVITVDTAVAHLAGAMGKPVWMLSHYRGCWRWLQGREDSPWYPTMWIYRQERPRDWSIPMERIRHDLARLVYAMP